MQKFNGSLIRQFPSLVTGNAAAGVQISVFIGSSNTFATLYATNNTAGAQLENPLTTDGKGFYSFYAADGQYRLGFSNGYPALEIQLLDAAQWVSDTESGSGLLGRAASEAVQLINEANTELQSALDGLINTGWFPAAGSFEDGGTITERNQYLQLITTVGADVAGGYSWGGALPKTVTAGSAPATSGGTGANAWVYRSDTTLSSALAAPDSTVMVGGETAEAVANRVTVPFDDYLDIAKLGIPQDGLDHTADIQGVIDGLDGVGVSIKLIVAPNIKFYLSSLTHNATSQLLIKYVFGDDLSFPSSAVGNSDQQMLYTDKGVSGISDNNNAYYAAPYHPSIITDIRSDCPSSWRSTAQDRTPINGSWVIRREGYSKAQLTYRDFDLEPDDTPSLDARKSGFDLTIWRTQWTAEGISSASWGSPPPPGALVNTVDGRLFVCRLAGANIILYGRKGNLLVGDTLYYNGIASSTTVTSFTRTITSLVNRISANGYDGGVGVNIPPERVVNTTFGVGGPMILEQGSGSVYGTAVPFFRVVDNMAAPTKGFTLRYNASTGWFELQNHAGALIATVSTSGTLQLPGGVAPNVYSLAQLNDASHPVNTDGKRQGKTVCYITNSRLVTATGSAATDTWIYQDGTVLATPV